jgi:hypothetical protein
VEKLGHKNKILAVILIFCFLVSAMFTVCAQAQSQAAIAVTKSPIPWVVNGVGLNFGAYEQVLISLYDTNGVLVTDLAEGMTDNAGNLMVTLALPLDLEGQFVITVKSETATASVECYLERFSETPTAGPATIQVTPTNSHIMNVTGRGFDASTIVTLNLVNDNGTTVYSIQQEVTTSSQGDFSAIIIIPTGMSGSYTLKAETPSTSATTSVTLPNLAGSMGATGATGADGVDGSSSNLLYVSLAVSVIALIVAAYAVVKKR